MAWTSMNDDIQDRRNDAEHFRVGVFAVSNTEGELRPCAVEAAMEVTPEPTEDPAIRERRRQWWKRSWLAKGNYEWTSDTVVCRGGAQRYTERIRDVLIRAFDRGGPNRALQVNFKIASKGGGETHLSARFGPKDFQTLIQAMLVADRRAALDAMNEELARQQN